MTSTVTSSDLKVDRDPMRVLSIAANLLPIEIIDARRANKTRWLVVVLLMILLGSLVAWDVAARQRTSSAQSSLADLQDQAKAVNRQANLPAYQGINAAKNQTAAINGQLNELMTQDLPWWQVTPAMSAAAATAHVVITDFNGSLDSAMPGTATTPAAGSAQVPGVAGPESIAQVRINGEAANKPSIALFLDALAKTTGFTDPYLTGAVAENGGYHFTVQVEVTTAYFKGRFSTNKADTTGGK
jgi:hypothetical protein